MPRCIASPLEAVVHTGVEALLSDPLEIRRRRGTQWRCRIEQWVLIWAWLAPELVRRLFFLCCGMASHAFHDHSLRGREFRRARALGVRMQLLVVSSRYEAHNPTEVPMIKRNDVSSSGYMRNCDMHTRGCSGEVCCSTVGLRGVPTCCHCIVVLRRTQQQLIA